MHYARFRRHGSPDITTRVPNGAHTTCDVAGCTYQDYYAKGRCKYHYAQDWHKAHPGKYAEYDSRRDVPHRQKVRAAWRTGRKQKLVDFYGGKCVDCGYDKHLAALEFDHVRGEKDCDIAIMLTSGAGWEALVAEANKCDLVCANCHRVRTSARRATCR
ncbi:hypothetical protein LCGC14_1580840 [marine sediment metagenome]|uniref:HNH endonuclease n=1 Tax=marine sediment metagenome TaxID=412755 RepID=A0A0F9J322_9ZZZZ